MIEIYLGNGIYKRVDGNSVGNEYINTTATSVIVAQLTTMDEWFYMQPLTSIEVLSFADNEQGAIKEYRLTFMCAENFMFNWNEQTGKDFKWADGEPNWDTETQYTLIITKGIETD